MLVRAVGYRGTTCKPSDRTAVTGMRDEGVGSAAQIKAMKQAEFVKGRMCSGRASWQVPWRIYRHATRRN